ncbi:ectomycorrhiza-regulated small secreted protein [Laccaria bicolor S238N-H82]|uniref:Ectomycorrhiza-regulated small secreted protein n=1 Tax=Laccaria bicolor (strain S238N-H82 / ATCC MYA-4686) TaxID=486041 RepID=B0E087_LACBS|nr:ectomycorrhiza-regulated small secreted protein [Laccaria bicolor S238N-H82]EDQ99780.1 ectomycorrhiza-regulated small secreted protein [Laccaria bicolor S238N-H82]|eukprot:XP_001889616.1 ectomycorrhiza-regulated small secreted protein [Laccaria bicolor S238N-H82]
MKLLPLISLALSLNTFTVLNALASSVVRARSLATVDEATKRELLNLLPRDPLPPGQSAIILCDGTSRTGNCYAYEAAVGTCNAVPDHFQTNLFSSFANQGDVCFLYTTDSCTANNCEACVDYDGWNDMTSFAAVYSWKCVVADSNGCSDANCVHK